MWVINAGEKYTSVGISVSTPSEKVYIMPEDIRTC